MTADRPDRPKPAFSAWAVIGLRPDGFEDLLDIGKSEDLGPSYSKFFDSPNYDSVYKRDLNQQPLRAPPMSEPTEGSTPETTTKPEDRPDASISLQDDIAFLTNTANRIAQMVAQIKVLRAQRTLLRSACELARDACQDNLAEANRKNEPHLLAAFRQCTKALAETAPTPEDLRDDG